MKLNKHEWIGLGAAVGAIVGAAIGSGIHQMGAWLPIGAGIGIAIADGISDRACANRRKSESGTAGTKLAARS
jgi:hypothetical protein